MSRSESRAKAENYSNDFKIPDWAGKPPPGLHLDVMKDGKMIQKLMIDEKKCYFFGRNRQMCDFQIDHQSCSRVHGALVWHKDLHRPFLIDCGSVHGTYIGSLRLESGKPQQVPIDSKLHFGASTRIYVIRERPGTVPNGIGRSDDTKLNSALPDDEEELDNLTEFNTAQNRRNTAIIELKENKSKKLATKNQLYIHFSDQEEVINPEDIDPSIGRFRNLVQETFIPNKRPRIALASIETSSYKSTSGHSSSMSSGSSSAPSKDTPTKDINHDHSSAYSHHTINPAFSTVSKLGLPLPNLAPEVESSYFTVPPSVTLVHSSQHITIDHNALSNKADDEPRKKKYAKEAWPGKKPAGFVVGPT